MNFNFNKLVILTMTNTLATVYITNHIWNTTLNENKNKTF
jgi:hypothetical protein